MVPLKSSDQIWYCLIDEICNHNKVLNFPIHKSVFNLFYQNPDLIYLKYKKENLSSPVVAYQGMPRGKLGIQLMLRRPDRKSALGAYSSLFTYNDAFRNAIWEGRLYFDQEEIEWRKRHKDTGYKGFSKIDEFLSFYKTWSNNKICSFFRQKEMAYYVSKF